MNKLTPKQEMFCKEYLIDLNATKAAIRAKYSEHTAQEIGSQNLSKLLIQERLQELNAERMKSVEITAEYVLTSLKNISDKCQTKELWNPQGATKAIELLGKHINLFKEGLLDNLPQGAYVQIYRPEPYTKKDMEAASRPTNRSVQVA